MIGSDSHQQACRYYILLFIALIFTLSILLCVIVECQKVNFISSRQRLVLFKGNSVIEGRGSLCNL